MDPHHGAVCAADPTEGNSYALEAPVMHRLAGDTIGGVLLNRWSVGTWLGKTPMSDEHMVALPTGQVVRARTVKEVDEPVHVEELLKVIPVHPHSIITMGQHNAAGGEGIAPHPVVPPPRHQPDHDSEMDADSGADTGDVRPRHAEPEPQPTKRKQQWRVMPRHLKSHGFTKGCRGCEGVQSKHPVAWRHSQRCRV